MKRISKLFYRHSTVEFNHCKGHSTWFTSWIMCFLTCLSVLLLSMLMCTHSHTHTHNHTQTHKFVNKIWSHSAELNHLVSSIAPVYALLFHGGLIFQPLWVLFLSVDRVFLFSADGGHPATKRQRSKIAAVAIPANHSGHSDRWNLVPPLLVPLYPSVLSFVLERHQIQSAECLSFRGAEKTAFILLSLWPYIKALELEESTMGEKASQGHAGFLATPWCIS